MSNIREVQLVGDGAAISWHPSYMDLEGIISKRIGSRPHRLSLREWPEPAWLKIKKPNFERRSAARANARLERASLPISVLGERAGWWRGCRRAIDQIAELLASRGLASFEPKIGESLIPDSDRIFLPGADLISDELGQFPKGTRAHVRVSTVVEAHVRNHQRISFPEFWKLFAMQRLSGNECRKHRSSRRTGAVLSVTGLQHSANFQPSLELSLPRGHRRTASRSS
jgi:hypothetical protein